MDGFLVINKSPNMTSYDVIRKIKKLLPPKTKIGHLGTLDPMTTGVLPIAIGQATKIIPYIEDETKEYIATLTLGGVSDTEDAWGNITLTHKTDVKEAQIKEVFKQMLGEIEQIPPMYSAVHHKGQKLYELARQGITVERKPRKIQIYELEILDIDIKKTLPTVKFRVLCSKGTYVRTLCKDIGEKLNVGGYLSSLERTKSGIFNLYDSYQLDEVIDKPDFLNKVLLPLDFPLQNWPIYKINDDQDYYSIINGNAIQVDLNLPVGNIRIYDQGESLLAIAQFNGNILKPIRVFKTV
ncbi:MAG: tRNA pseudouridine(55) synthase TruB [Syntrophomonadaceae bacterium]|nr:tRNA pseudouridine(55) synthase TruB [Syntrophomonadaceae bacterium]